MFTGQTCTLTFIVQNTGTSTWNGQYYFIQHGWEQMNGLQPSQLISQASTITQNVSPGDTISFSSTFTAPAPVHPGSLYNIRFEMGIYDEYYGYIGFSQIDVGRPWPAYTVNICVEGPCKVYVPILIR